MDQAHQGTKLLEQKEYAAAIECFNRAIAVNPESPEYYIKRSTAYGRVSPADNVKALTDADTAVALAKQRGKRELIAQAQLRRGITSSSLGRWADAAKCFEWVKALTPKEKSLAVWESRAETKLKALQDDDERLVATIKEYPEVDIAGVKELAKTNMPEPKTAPFGGDGTAEATVDQAVTTPAPTPIPKIRHDWYQTTENVNIEVMAKGVPKEKAVVDIQPTSLSVNFPTPTGSDFDLSFDPLFAAIDPSGSSFKVLSTKIQISLKKSTPGKKWHNLEGDASLPDITTTQIDETTAAVKKAVLTDDTPSGPAYPTSSKHGAKDWDKLAEDLTKKKAKKDGADKSEAKEDKDEDEYDSDGGGDPVNGFFKKLYSGLDPDSRRAMMKSYQESNGTALSTNWDEVKKGKVETSPPDGMEAKNWER